MLLQDKTSKIEKLQQLLHSERQRMELLIGAVLVCVFLLSFLKAFVAGLASAADPWRGARRACQSNRRGRSRSTTGSRVVVDAETVDNFTACHISEVLRRES